MIHVTLEPQELGLFDHDLACWLCNERRAVYVGNPRWCFAPCWECQRKYAAANPEAWWPVAASDRRHSRPRWKVWAA